MSINRWLNRFQLIYTAKQHSTIKMNKVIVIYNSIDESKKHYGGQKNLTYCVSCVKFWKRQLWSLLTTNLWFHGTGGERGMGKNLWGSFSINRINSILWLNFGDCFTRTLIKTQSCVHFIVCELYSNSSLKNANFKNHFYSVSASPRAYTCHAAKDPEGQIPKG